MKILTILLCLSVLISAQICSKEIALMAPTGPYAIGETHIALIDESRTMKPADTKGPRKIAARIFYPIDKKPAAPTKPYLSKQAGDYLISTMRDEAYRMPQALGQGWEKSIATHSYVDQPLSKAKTSWPVLLYTHGINSMVELGQNIIEDIVSNGFIVVAFETTNISGSAVFPDGSVVYAAKPAAGADWWGFMIGQFGDIVIDFDFILASIQKTKGEVLGKQFAGQVNLNAVGAFGISFGGGAAIDFAARNKSVKSAINLDGSIFRDLAAGDHKPGILHLFSEGHNSGDPSLIDNSKKFKGPISFVEVKGSLHENYGDTPYLLKEFGVANSYPATGSIAPDRHIQIVRAAILEHFNQTLLSSDPSKYEESIRAKLNGYKEITMGFKK